MKFLIFTLFFTLNGFSKLTNECVRSTFSMAIDRPGALWGLVDYDLKVSKQRCVVRIFRKNILSSNWEVDLCREPVHVKVHQYFTQKDLLKEKDCKKKSKHPFCVKKRELLDLIKEEGLVHVKGERENTTSDHGRLYCLNSLLKKYLNKSQLMSMTKDYEKKKVVVPIQRDFIMGGINEHKPELEVFENNIPNAEVNQNEKLKEF